MAFNHRREFVEKIDCDWLPWTTRQSWLSNIVFDKQILTKPANGIETATSWDNFCVALRFAIFPGLVGDRFVAFGAVSVRESRDSFAVWLLGWKPYWEFGRANSESYFCDQWKSEKGFHRLKIFEESSNLMIISNHRGILCLSSWRWRGSMEKSAVDSADFSD